MAYNGLAKHAQGKVFVDHLFGSSAAAKEAAQKYGPEAVTNGTIGSICDENGKFVMLPTVEKVFRSLKNEEFGSYASVRGTPEYLKAVEALTFGESRPDCYVEAVATSGGAGAIVNAVWNYADIGDAVLTHDWYWQPYNVICQDSLHRLETFAFYDEKHRFNSGAFGEKVWALLKKQDSLLILLNTPNNNPTGYSLTDEEWDGVLSLLKDCAEDKTKTVSLLVDIAYIEYMTDPVKGRAFMKKFAGLPENLIILIAFSASKVFTIYGQRTGALVCVTGSKNVAEEFVNAAKITGRTRWSTISHSGMTLVPRICFDPALKAQCDAERRAYVDLIDKRAHIFVEEAAQCGMEILPYCGGFFVSLPAQRPLYTEAKLREQNIFIAALAVGIRVAVCSLPVEKVKGLAKKIQDSL